MPNANDFFSGKYIVANDLPKDRPMTAVIVSCTEEVMSMSGDTKLVLRFANQVGKPWRKGLPLNPTNGRALIAAFGSDYSTWAGHRVEVWAAPTQFAGKSTYGARVKPLGNGHSTPMPGSPDAIPPDSDLDDEVPI
jgi:hypothetical protein